MPIYINTGTTMDERSSLCRDHKIDRSYRRPLSFLCVSRDYVLWLAPHSTCIRSSSPILQVDTLTPDEQYAVENSTT
jgi:hypothetical protein